MATVPLSGTNIRLLSGIPFANDYNHTRWFDSITDQTNYFMNQTVTFNKTDYNFQRIEGKHVIKVDTDIDSLWGTNYVMFQNTSYNSKWFYGFVTKLEYVQRNCTYVYFEIDVLQTWMFNINWNPSFVVREHGDEWNTDGSPVVQTLDEGLNYGTEYDIISVDRVLPDTLFLIIVAKSQLHNSNTITATASGIVQPLNYYIVPFRPDGSVPNISLSGDTSQQLGTLANTLTAIMTSDKTVGDVSSIYITEYFGYDTSFDGTTSHFDSSIFDLVTVGGSWVLYCKGLTQYATKQMTYTDKYSNYIIDDCGKLLMYPYTVLELDDMKGNRVQLKNEYINGTDIVVNIRGSLGTSNKVAYSVDNYLQNADSNNGFTYATTMQHAVISTNPNDVPVLDDMLSAYLQGNRNQINNQKNQSIFNAVTNIAGNAIGGLTSFGHILGGYVSGGAGGYNQMLGGSGGLGQSANGIVQSAGNSVFTQLGLMAKQQDIANVPPSVTSMGNNSNFDFGNSLYGMYIIRKQIKPEYRKKLNDFFKKNGYKINEVKIPNLHTRQNWNYVQTSQCNIKGNFNDEDMKELKQIFDSGITLWHTDDVGNYDLQNGVL